MTLAQDVQLGQSVEHIADQTPDSPRPEQPHVVVGLTDDTCWLRSPAGRIFELDRSKLDNGHYRLTHNPLEAGTWNRYMDEFTDWKNDTQFDPAVSDCFMCITALTDLDRRLVPVGVVLMALSVETDDVTLADGTDRSHNAPDQLTGKRFLLVRR